MPPTFSANGPIVTEGQSRRDRPSTLQLIPIDSFFGFNDDVVYTEQIDVAHHLFLGARRDRQHGDDRANAKIIPSIVSKLRSL
jgi:hypothetical protein